ncbi:MAG: acyltransferase family protein, partial [Desulfotomaculaceae bacterium]|nr:acyltransferase family protein [Desulfotomaculaceae bacterium]
PLGHLWSLAVEEQFYLLWPLLLGLGLRYIPRRGRLIGLITALVIASATAMAVIYQPGLDPNRVYYGTDTRAFALLIGAVLALLWPSRKLSAGLSPRQRMTLDAAGGSALLAISAMIWLSNQYQSFLYYGGLLFFSIISAVLVAVLAHPASCLGRLFGISPLRRLGVWSYGIYLWHYPVIVLTSPGVNTGGLDIGLAIAQAVLSISLAAISWYFVEEPIRHGKWKQYLAQFSNGFKLRPKLFRFRGKASLTSIICIFGAFILAVSGCSVISQAQHKGLPSEPASIMEPANAALNTEFGESNGNGAEAPSDTDTLKQGADQNHGFTGKGVTAIGDSVLVGVEPELKRLFPDITVDAAIGRQMHQAPQVIKNLQSQGILGKTVIIELGGNGAFTEKQFMDILSILGNDRRIVIINARVPKPWESAVNQILARAAGTHPNVELVDWYTASSGHNEYFRADGVHLKEAGVKAYVSLLANALTP